MPLVQEPFLGVPGSASACVTVRGGLDAATCRRLDELLTELIDRHGVRSLVVDVKGLTFIDSAGIYVLVQAMKRARQAGGDLTLSGVSPGAHKVLDICGLTSVFGTADGGWRPGTAEAS